MEEIVRAMNWVIEQGFAFYWGTSEWSAAQLMEVWDSRRRGKEGGGGRPGWTRRLWVCLSLHSCPVPHPHLANGGDDMPLRRTQLRTGCT